MDAFTFNFSQVSLDSYDTDSIPTGVDLTATIKELAYRDLAKKGSGETKIKLVVKMQVHLDSGSTLFDLMISPNQAYLLKQLMSAADIDANQLDGVELTAEGLGDLLNDKVITVSFRDNEWNGKVYKNVAQMKKHVVGEVEYNPDLPF